MSDSILCVGLCFGDARGSRNAYFLSLSEINAFLGTGYIHMSGIFFKYHFKKVVYSGRTGNREPHFHLLEKQK